LFLQISLFDVFQVDLVVFGRDLLLQLVDTLDHTLEFELELSDLLLSLKEVL
jgi:hypothetical protein